MLETAQGWFIHSDLFLIIGMVGTFTTGASSVSTNVHMWVRRNEKLGKFCTTWLRKSHKAQVQGGHGSYGDFSAFPSVFMGGGGVGIDAEDFSCVEGGGCDTVSIG